MIISLNWNINQLTEETVKATINNISVAGMLRLLCNYKKTGVLKVEGAEITGEIEILEGEIIEANTRIDTDKRKAAINLLTVIGDGTFYFQEKSLEAKRNLGFCVEDIILESARVIREKNQVNIEDYLLPENEILKISKLAENKKMTITFLSKEWNFLINFNGDNSIAAVIQNSKLDKSKAEIIIYGLISAGLLRRTRFKVPEITKIAKNRIGNIGAAIVDAEMIKLNIDKTRMGMKDFIELLNNIEKSFTEIIGKEKAKTVIEEIWANTK